DVPLLKHAQVADGRPRGSLRRVQPLRGYASRPRTKSNRRREKTPRQSGTRGTVNGSITRERSLYRRNCKGVGSGSCESHGALVGASAARAVGPTRLLASM